MIGNPATVLEATAQRRFILADYEVRRVLDVDVGPTVEIADGEDSDLRPRPEYGPKHRLAIGGLPVRDHHSPRRGP